MRSVIEVENLVKKYKTSDKAAVNDVSFNVQEGEFFTFLGPNGAGKTTTISILNTTLAKSSGRVMIAGHDIDKHPLKVRQNIGVIFQTPSLDSNLTAEENIRFHATLYGVFPFSPLYSLMPQSYKKKVDELASILGIQDTLHQPIKTFSGGMKRKLEIIRGLIHSPKVLFLDEPTTGLDPESRKNLWEYLKTVRKNTQTTIFLTTHYLEEAENSDRVCIITNGQIASLSTPEKLKRSLVTEKLIVDADDRPALLAQLKKLKLAPVGDGPFTLNLRNESVQEIIAQLSKAKIKLSVLRTQTPTLEEAYLAVVEKNHAHS
ncbi:MAG TPA: ABC transporter ATP-binding protein [Vitreimonas sp.]|nr:ABC transporter ATP-binding protein [Vitreimonas sp.]